MFSFGHSNWFSYVVNRSEHQRIDFESPGDSFGVKEFSEFEVWLTNWCFGFGCVGGRFTPLEPYKLYLKAVFTSPSRGNHCWRFIARVQLANGCAWLILTAKVKMEQLHRASSRFLYLSILMYAATFRRMEDVMLFRANIWDISGVDFVLSNSQIGKITLMRSDISRAVILSFPRISNFSIIPDWREYLRNLHCFWF